MPAQPCGPPTAGITPPLAAAGKSTPMFHHTSLAKAMAVAAVAVKDFSAVLMTVLMVVSATVLAGAPEALAAVAAVLAAILLPQLLQQ